MQTRTTTKVLKKDSIKKTRHTLGEMRWMFTFSRTVQYSTVLSVCIGNIKIPPAKHKCFWYRKENISSNTHLLLALKTQTFQLTAKKK